MDLIEIKWRKSSYSGANGGECVEVGSPSGMIAIRDSKDPSGPKLIMSHNDFRRFTEVIKNL